jgi:3-oxoacyl-[acyl-carrier protein] reductase
MTLEGKVALIIGGGRGIGAATARMMAAQGASVVIAYLRNAAAAENIVQEISSKGGQAIAVQTDARDEQQVHHLVQQAIDSYGHIDILIYSAPPHGVFKPFLRLSWEEFIRTVNSELKGVFETTQAVLPFMRRQRYGRIVYLASNVATSPSMQGASSLGAAFAALISLAKFLAKEHGPDGITVNTVLPSMVNTDLSAMIPPEMRQYLASITPLQRIAEPEDIARVVTFLAGDESGFMTGTSVPVNGGLAM